MFKVNYSKNAGGEIFLYDSIGSDPFFGGVGAKEFSQAISDLGKVSQLRIRINSAGGDVFEGFAIYNQIRRLDYPVDVYVDGIAASIASVIAMAGDKIYMAEPSQMMMHNPWGFGVGDADSLRSVAAELDSLKDAIAGVYFKRSGVSHSRIANWMDEETWFSETSAVDAGLADQVFEPVKAAAWSIPANLARAFRHAPAPHQTPRLDARRGKIASILEKRSGAV